MQKIDLLGLDIACYKKKLKNGLEVLEQLISLNEALEEILANGKKTSFQYRKKMLQYVQNKG